MREPCGGEAPFVGPRTGRGEGHFDAAHADLDQRADLQELQADRAAGGLGELGVGEADAAQRAEQDVGHRGEPQAQLVGPHGRRRGAVGEQIGLAFLDAVLHLAARAVEVFVERLARQPSRLQRGDEEARIAFAARPFGLADRPGAGRPAVFVVHRKSLNTPRRLARVASDRRRASAARSPIARLQPDVAGQAENVVDLVGFAPGHQRLAAEAGVGAQHDPAPAASARGFARRSARSPRPRPPQPSMFERRSLAASRWRPQKM